MIDFAQLVERQRADRFIPVKTLSLDPGDTTGFAVFDGTDLVQWGEVTGDHPTMDRLFCAIQPTVIVCEEFRIYAKNAGEMIHSDVPTLRLIGGIEMLSYLYDKPLHKIGAGTHKPFATDDKLKAWHLYQPLYKHSNDAIRLGAYFLIFGE